MASTLAAAPMSGRPDVTGFLDAQRVLSQFRGGEPLAFLFGMSGTADPFRVFLDAACAARERTADARFLPFGTLAQFIAGGGDARHPEILLLLPWDFAPELDWRSGVPRDRVALAPVLSHAERVADSVARRGARVFYLPAPTPPVAGHPADDAALRQQIDALAVRIGATFLPAGAFTLSGYFSSGCPVSGGWLGRVASCAVDALLPLPTAPAKLLVTDLDNTLWRGVLAESGPDGIAYDAEGGGYRHYVYQSLLLRLRREGALLTAVTRNDYAVVAPVLDGGSMVLSSGDFVAVYASYNAKSSQIRDLAKRLNLGLDAVVFIDDNPLEVEEVRTALPDVRVLTFPDRDDGLPEFLDSVATIFGQRAVTEEDRSRTELYRRRADTASPSIEAGADLTAFLASLDMRLTIHDRSSGDRSRAVQLINKTNQFNANGRRWTDAEVDAALGRGARLITATLSDRSGSHGEIAACLVDAAGVIEALVMSCRVFQRRVEYAFLSTLLTTGPAPTAIRFASTPRNEPFRQFVDDDALQAGADGTHAIDQALWLERHRPDVELFAIDQG